MSEKVDSGFFQFIMGTSSLQDGMGTSKDFLSAAREKGVKSLCLADQSTTLSYVSFYPDFKSAEIKPIMGVRVSLDFPYLDNLHFLKENEVVINDILKMMKLPTMDLKALSENDELLEGFKDLFLGLGESIDFYGRSKSKNKDEVFLKSISPLFFECGYGFPNFIDVYLYFNQGDKDVLIYDAIRSYLKDIGLSDKEVKSVKNGDDLPSLVSRFGLDDDEYFVSTIKNYGNFDVSDINIPLIAEKYKNLSREMKYRQLRITALNSKGVVRINELLSSAYKSGQKKIKIEKSGERVKRADFSYPLVDVNDLFEKNDDILVHSIVEEDDIIFDVDSLGISFYGAKRLKDNIGSNFVIGLTRNFDKNDGERYVLQEKRIESALFISEKLGVPCYATHVAKFPKKEDFKHFDLKSATLTDQWYESPTRRTTGFASQYVRSDAELYEMFSDLPRNVISNSYALANNSNPHLLLGKNYLPMSPIPDDYARNILKEEFSRLGLDYSDDYDMSQLESIFAKYYVSNISNNNLSDLEIELDIRKEFSNIVSKPYLAEKTWSGIEKLVRMTYKDDADERLVRYRERFEEEINIICDMGFAGYFLIVHDFIAEAKRRGIPVGPGRGSGAGSIVAYGLGITIPDPIEFDLVFERFLNPERVSMPDFDIDFCTNGRADVIDYVMGKYGRDSVAYISTVSKFKPKNAFKTVMKSLGYTVSQRNYISDHIPEDPFLKIKDLMESPEFNEFLDERNPIRKIAHNVEKLENETSQTGVHAGGVVISPTKLTDFCAVVRNPDGSGIATIYDKDDVEKAGLVKFDFLGLSTLTVIKDAVLQVGRNHGVNIDIDRIDLNDEKTYDLLKSALTQDVFQLSSSGMKQLVNSLQVESIEDISALVALYRPGPMQSGMLDKYVKRKQGVEEVKYLHPKVAGITKNTFGTVIYQEQVMQIAQVLAGYSLGGADLLRRAMGKKKPEEMEKQKKIFLEGALRINESDREEELKGVIDGISLNMSGLDFMSNYIDESGHFSIPEKVEEFLREFVGFSDKDVEVFNYEMNSEELDIDNLVNFYKNSIYKPLREKVRAVVGDGDADLVSSNIYFSLFEYVRYMNIFNVIEKFAGYGFNKAHSLAYAFVAYQTAYLKANYPEEFFSAVLSNQNDLEKLSPIIYDMEHNFKINLIAPSVNSSNYMYKADPKNKSVYAGLINVKSLGKYGKLIEKERQENGDFKSLQDLVFRIHYRNSIEKETANSKLSAGAFKGLLYSGSLDCLIKGASKMDKITLMRSREYLNKEYQAIMSSYPENVEELVAERLDVGYYNPVIISDDNDFSMVKDLIVKSVAYAGKLENLIPDDYDFKSAGFENYLCDEKEFIDMFVSGFSDFDYDLKFLKDSVDLKILKEFVKFAKKAPFDLTEKQKADYAEIKTKVIGSLTDEQKKKLAEISLSSFGDDKSYGKVLEMVVNAKKMFSVKKSFIPVNLYDVKNIYNVKNFSDSFEKSRFVYNTLMKRNKQLHTDIVAGIRDYLVMDDSYFLNMEKEFTGGYLTMHPVLLNDALGKTKALYSPYYTVANIDDIAQDESRVEDVSNKTLYVAASMDNIKIRDTKNGGTMAILTLSDQTGDIEVVMFDDIYSKIEDYLKNGVVGSIGLSMNKYRDRTSIQIVEVKLHSPDISQVFTINDYIKPQHKMKESV